MIQFNELLGNRKLIIILELFINNSTTQFLQKDIQKKTGLSKATLIKWLNFLEKENFIDVKKEAVSKKYSLNKENPIIKQLKILYNLMLLKNFKNKIQNFNVKAYLYGSASRGEDVEESDIDILIIGKIKKDQIINDVNKISKKINRQIKIEIFTSLEWSKIASDDKAFFERVEKDRVEF